MTLGARILDRAIKSTGFLTVSALKIEFDLHQGGTDTVVREVMERGHAVGILAYDPRKDQVVLANEMRPGLLVAGAYPYSSNVAAGGIAPGESAVSAARRETVEELGLRLRHARIIHDRVYVSTGGTSENITLVFGIVKAPDPARTPILGNAGEQENIKVEVLSACRFVQMALRDELKDFKTLTAAYWLKLNRAGIRRQYGHP